MRFYNTNFFRKIIALRIFFCVCQSYLSLRNHFALVYMSIARHVVHIFDLLYLFQQNLISCMLLFSRTLCTLYFILFTLLKIFASNTITQKEMISYKKGYPIRFIFNLSVMVSREVDFVNFCLIQFFLESVIQKIPLLIKGMLINIVFYQVHFTKVSNSDCQNQMS